jgi:hypothetical protein
MVECLDEGVRECLHVGMGIRPPCLADRNRRLYIQTKIQYMYRVYMNMNDELWCCTRPQ